jgi:hypothetical protein
MREVPQRADDLLVVRRLGDHHHPGRPGLGGEGGDRLRGVAPVAEPLRDVYNTLQRSLRCPGERGLASLNGRWCITAHHGHPKVSIPR